MQEKLVVLSGAGISQESGIDTFRGAGGLWEKYDVTELANPAAWENDPELVLRFYNMRRKKVIEAKPNLAHKKIAELENHFDVHVITQNVDDLHERAGSSKVLHLHGEIRKARSTKDENLIYDIEGSELNIGDACELGSQLRPHVVWFGEAVPAIEDAIDIVSKADILLIIGTSLNVYPAAGLVNYCPEHCNIHLIDPGTPYVDSDKVNVIRKKATEGILDFVNLC
ncbi:MAG: NAD-dependent deacylase [Candidatus Delongbacteria bacterium]|jgi:NAD-dependent deacetylase|nr:NAD-dependent deacylase [Candidatus Delongbacteria bacterium]